MRNPIRSLLALVVAAFAAVLAPSRAEACSCGFPLDVFPEDGATHVPTDARVWAFGRKEDGQEVVFATADGTPVEFERTVITLPFEALIVVSPKAPLEPQTEYDVTVQWNRVRFRTGNGPSTNGPAPVVETGRVGYVHEDWSSSCSPVYGATLMINPDPNRVLTLAVFEGTPAPEFAKPEGAVDVAFGGAGWPADAITFASGACHVSWPDAKKGDVARVRLGAFDLAGRFSGWSEPIAIAADRDGYPGGCATAGAGIAAMAVVLAGVQRRKRRR